MKWCSVKKYIMPEDCDLFFRLQNNELSNDIKYVVGKMHYSGFINATYYSYEDLRNHKITHFIIPDIVEYESEIT